MVVAELEVFHSRPVAPTRRVALGLTRLPMHPPPGHGSVLLAAVASTFAPMVDGDLFEEYVTLLGQIEHGQRISQPRLRHRFQKDRIGLTRSVHRLSVEGDRMRIRIEKGTGSAAQFLLAAAYATAPLLPAERAAAIAAIRVGLTWNGDFDSRFVSRVAGKSLGASLPLLAITDPEAWARLTLGFADAAEVTRSDVQRQFRDALRGAHPDHGGATDDAATRIAAITEARRILLS